MRSINHVIKLFLVFWAICFDLHAASGVYPLRDIVEGQYVVKLRDNLDTNQSLSSIKSIINEARTKAKKTQIDLSSVKIKPTLIESFSNKNHKVSLKSNYNTLFKSTVLLDISPNVISKEELLEVLNRHYLVIYAEPVFRRSIGIEREDTLQTARSAFNLENTQNTITPIEQWYMQKMNQPEAKEFLSQQEINTGGDPSVVIAVIDSGVDLQHPEFEGRLWINPNEIPGNGIDDDLNGVVDDIHGANFVSDSISGDITDYHGHGTHVAGIVSANNDESGIVGIAHNAKLMVVRAAASNGSLTSIDIAESILYAAENGADVINMSFGGRHSSFLERDALATAYNSSVLVAAAGNNALPNDIRCGSPNEIFYPASYSYVIGVMASDNEGNLASFSNYDCIPKDAVEYELAAPGQYIYSTLPDGGFAAWDGTSMAAPIISASSALLRSFYSDKDVYSSRFIMGQIAGTLDGNEPDIFAALTEHSLPDLSVLRSHLLDSKRLSAFNDVDGRVDSGETIELALELKSHWGGANDVTVTLLPRSVNGSEDDPYVDMVIDQVVMGDIGAFNTLNNFEFNDDSEITGFNEAFLFNVAPETPNNYLLSFSVLLEAKDLNGEQYSRQFDNVINPRSV